MNDKLQRPHFPPAFVWGVATSAFQIEGASQIDGRGPSIWDTFSHTPGKVIDGSNGDVVCDHYHRFRDDVKLIAALGLDAYRFSISWPRVQPTGQGAWNEKGLAFYDALVDELLAHGIKPYVTLYHWDLPQALQDSGGWQSRDITLRFADYALKIAQRLGDRVKSFATLNEPWCVATLGHEVGRFAPGLRSRGIAAQVSHHLLLAHGHAVTAMRTLG
jgi:beta-glucosidase